MKRLVSLIPGLVFVGFGIYVSARAGAYRSAQGALVWLILVAAFVGGGVLLVTLLRRQR